MSYADYFAGKFRCFAQKLECEMKFFRICTNFILRVRQNFARCLRENFQIKMAGGFSGSGGFSENDSPAQ